MPPTPPAQIRSGRGSSTRFDLSWYRSFRASLSRKIFGRGRGREWVRLFRSLEKRLNAIHRAIQRFAFHDVDQLPAVFTQLIEHVVQLRAARPVFQLTPVDEARGPAVLLVKRHDEIFPLSLLRRR